jgi:hypothetical protein
LLTKDSQYFLLDIQGFYFSHSGNFLHTKRFIISFATNLLYYQQQCNYSHSSSSSSSSNLIYVSYLHREIYYLLCLFHYLRSILSLLLLTLFIIRAIFYSFPFIFIIFPSLFEHLYIEIYNTNYCIGLYGEPTEVFTLSLL